MKHNSLLFCDNCASPVGKSSSSATKKPTTAHPTASPTNLPTPATKAPTTAHTTTSPQQMPTPATLRKPPPLLIQMLLPQSCPLLPPQIELLLLHIIKQRRVLSPFITYLCAIGGVSILIAGTVLYRYNRYNRYNHLDRVSDEDEMSFTEFLMTPSEWFG